MRAYQVRVTGRVQRVGYRRHVLEAAQELGLAGFVRNEEDGSVSVFVQGEEKSVEEFLERIRSPPPPALVRDLSVKERRPRKGLKSFRVIYGRLADELQEGFGAMQSVFMNYWGEFRDFRQEFRDFRQEFQDFRQEFREFRQEFRDFRDASLRLSEQTLEEVRAMRQDLKAILDERLARIEKDIAEIKARLGLA
ncbi:MAG: acylphosphatase [Aigarchaeota archaeon]|nr:acylphosphatase [Aigarchaeota archaeon]MCS7127237.1 acylphosphatase [Candidatus Calditenuaceae archaeon]MCX8203430.1 acylphosphatase [Nitrososphaeria archaeon]